MKRLFFIFFVFIAVGVYGQKGIIRGTVIEEASADPAIGVNILIKDTSVGAVTDLDGAFSIEVAEGAYTLQISYLGFQSITIENVEVKAGEVTILGDIRISEDVLEMQEVVVTAEEIRKTEVALLTLKKKSPSMMDGISSEKIKLTGDGTAVEAAKRVTGVSVEGGKYVYVRGLGDRYSKTTLNNADIPGLDPDRNTLQMDIFPTSLIENITVIKNFTAEHPADFTGGLLNIETKSFPEERILDVSVSTSFNPDMHFNSNYLTYQGGDTDFLGFDDGARTLPPGADQTNIPTPISGDSKEEVVNFIKGFNPELAANRQTSFMDFSAGMSFGDQINLNPDKYGMNGPKLGYIFSLSYKMDHRYYDDVIYGEFQRFIDPEKLEMRYATLQNGQLGERNVLIGALGGLAYKNKNSKIRLTAMHLQNGESRAGKFRIDNDGEAVGQSGYIASSDNLEFNERALSNILLNGTHKNTNSGWEIDWLLSPTFSSQEDPDIRKTAFTLTPVDTLFIAGAGGNPARIWRSLNEFNATAKFDITKKYRFNNAPAKFKFGAGHAYKQRDYEILFFDIQFFATQSWPNPDPSVVLSPENLYPNRPNSIYYQSGNNSPNPNAYESNVNNTAFYVSNEIEFLPGLKTILGLRAENYVQRHTGRDQRYASGDFTNGRNLDNEKVLESLDLFPSVNLVYELVENQNLRGSYSRTIARPSFKELSFAQILDPITNRIFNGSLFTYSDWNGRLTETRIDNFDLRWEMFMENGQIFSVSAFFKNFDNPIELVRIPEQQTSTEYQPRNVGDGILYGVELEFRKDLNFIAPFLNDFKLSTNVTLVESLIDMTLTEFNSRKTYEKSGQEITDTRQMAGQAPFVINTGLVYNNNNLGLDAGLFYNVKGETLEIVGAGLFPDIFYQPFHSLNFSLNKKIGEDQKTTIDFKISNILNDRIESLYQSFNAEAQPFNSLAPGRSFGIGISHRF